MAHSTVVNGVSIYNLSAGKVAPSWAPPNRLKELKKDEAYRRRIELLQDLAFPEASQTISVTQDGRYVVATGTYPPRVRVFDTAELSMKFERYMDSTPVACVPLGADGSKLAFLQDDRNVELHAAYGKHYRTRIPRAGRCMVYHQASAELLVGASTANGSSSSDPSSPSPASTSEGGVYRLSLEEGRFLAPLATNAPAVNKIAVSRVTALIGLACDGGTCEFWDPRAHKRVTELLLPANTGSAADATCLAFEEGGVGLVVGTSDGRALLYDMRHGSPLLTRPHPYGRALVDVRFHRGAAADGAGQRLVMSTDSKQCRLWRREGGKLYTAIEAPATINDVAVAADEMGVGGVDSGLIFMAGEQERVMAYYLPSAGVAPRWASFLDSVTEELEEFAPAGAAGASSAAVSSSSSSSAPTPTTSSIYDDYRFVTREELAQLGLTHLVGGPLLRAYMHGFFMDARLHARVKSVLDPGSSASERWRRDKVREAVEAQRGSRIALEDGDLPKVNRELAARLREEEESRAARRAAGAARKGGAGAAAAAAAAAAGPSEAPGSSVLRDDRFSRLFTDASFAIDPEEEAAVAARRGVSVPVGKGKAAAGGGATSGAAGGKRKRRRGGGQDSEDEAWDAARGVGGESDDGGE
jgi:ribosome biogenesis protein ENP2